MVQLYNKLLHVGPPDPTRVVGGPREVVEKSGNGKRFLNVHYPAISS